MTQLAAGPSGDLVNSRSHVGACYTLTKSAQRLRVPLNTLRHWVHQGRIEPPAKRGPHGAFLYNEQQLERIAAKVHKGGKRVRLQDPNRCTLSETADLMGIGMDTLLTWRLLGFIPQPETNHGGRLCTYSAELVEKFVAQVPDIRERQENARRKKQAQALRDAIRPCGRYSLSQIAELANIATTTLWRYRKLGLIPEPDQAGPGTTRSYSEQMKADILVQIPQIFAENQARAILAMKAVLQNPELRKTWLEKVRIGNADPDVRRQRSESARNAMSEEQRRAAGERSRRRWARTMETLRKAAKVVAGRPAIMKEICAKAEKEKEATAKSWSQLAIKYLPDECHEKGPKVTGESLRKAAAYWRAR
jgi:DNA-binding transcriptional MerR regulator